MTGFIVFNTKKALKYFVIWKIFIYFVVGNNQIKNILMKQFIKYLGVIAILAGVGVFYAYSVSSHPTNNQLVLGISLVVGGLLGHLLLNKFID